MSVHQIRPDVLEEVAQERLRQVDKWGHQNHPNGTGSNLWLFGSAEYLRRHGLNAGDLADYCRQRCDGAHAHGAGTYEHILTEEWAEAVASDDPQDLRAELIQLAAVACAWVEAIDHQTTPHPDPDAARAVGEGGRS